VRSTTCAPSSRTRCARSTCATSWPPTRRRTGARAESERFRRFAYDDLIQRDNAGLDLICLRDESLEDMENLPPPHVIAQDLEAALAEFAAIARSLAPPDDEGR
jgi:type I restriction enzyme M protein